MGSFALVPHDIVIDPILGSTINNISGGLRWGIIKDSVVQSNSFPTSANLIAALQAIWGGGATNNYAYLKGGFWGAGGVGVPTGVMKLRVNFFGGPAWSLDGAAAIDFASLPAGFTVVTAQVNFAGRVNDYLNDGDPLGVFPAIHLQFDDSGLDESPALPIMPMDGLTYATFLADPVPSALDLYLNGCGIRVVFDGNPDKIHWLSPTFDALSITGTWGIAQAVTYLPIGPGGCVILSPDLPYETTDPSFHFTGSELCPNVGTPPGSYLVPISAGLGSGYVLIPATIPIVVPPGSPPLPLVFPQPSPIAAEPLPPSGCLAPTYPVDN
jgi:hypothetical protein